MKTQQENNTTSKQDSKQATATAQQPNENNKSYCSNNKNKSIIPAINETERFIEFLNKKFSLGLPSDYVVNIHKASKQVLGYFMPASNPQAYKTTENNKEKPLYNITINTLHLKNSNPYEVIAHETAHFINNVLGINDTSSNQYHNKHFKKQAERLGLTCERTNKGYALTKTNDYFNKLVQEFKPQKEVFNIFQTAKEQKKGTRNYLFMCSCGFKVRCGDKGLNAKCLKCGGEFKLQEQKNKSARFKNDY